MTKQPAKGTARDPGKSKSDAELSRELEETFPASDPPSATQPGAGITGAEKPRRKGKSGSNAG